MFRGMTCLEPGAAARLALCPLAEAPALPHVVVVEGPPEQLMWLLLAEVNLRGGERLLGSTAVLQATCVDATIIPHLEQRLNFTMGCYGCREATDLHAFRDRRRLSRRAARATRRRPGLPQPEGGAARARQTGPRSARQRACGRQR